MNFGFASHSRKDNQRLQHHASSSSTTKTGAYDAFGNEMNDSTDGSSVITAEPVQDAQSQQRIPHVNLTGERVIITKPNMVQVRNCIRILNSRPIVFATMTRIIDSLLTDDVRLRTSVRDPKSIGSSRVKITDKTNPNPFDRLDPIQLRLAANDIVSVGYCIFCTKINEYKGDVSERMDPLRYIPILHTYPDGVLVNRYTVHEVLDEFAGHTISGMHQQGIFLPSSMTSNSSVPGANPRISASPLPAARVYMFDPFGPGGELTSALSKVMDLEHYYDIQLEQAMMMESICNFPQGVFVPNPPQLNPTLSAYQNVTNTILPQHQQMAHAAMAQQLSARPDQYGALHPYAVDTGAGVGGGFDAGMGLGDGGGGGGGGGFAMDDQEIAKATADGSIHVRVAEHLKPIRNAFGTVVGSAAIARLPMATQRSTLNSITCLDQAGKVEFFPRPERNTALVAMRSQLDILLCQCLNVPPEFFHSEGAVRSHEMGLDQTLKQTMSHWGNMLSKIIVEEYIITHSDFIANLSFELFIEQNEHFSRMNDVVQYSEHIYRRTDPPMIYTGDLFSYDELSDEIQETINTIYKAEASPTSAMNAFNGSIQGMTIGDGGDYMRLFAAQQQIQWACREAISAAKKMTVEFPDTITMGDLQYLLTIGRLKPTSERRILSRLFNLPESDFQLVKVGADGQPIEEKGDNDNNDDDNNDDSGKKEKPSKTAEAKLPVKEGAERRDQQNTMKNKEKIEKEVGEKTSSPSTTATDTDVKSDTKSVKSKKTSGSKHDSDSDSGSEADSESTISKSKEKEKKQSEKPSSPSKKPSKKATKSHKSESEADSDSDSSDSNSSEKKKSLKKNKGKASEKKKTSSLSKSDSESESESDTSQRSKKSAKQSKPVKSRDRDHDHEKESEKKEKEKEKKTDSDASDSASVSEEKKEEKKRKAKKPTPDTKSGSDSSPSQASSDEKTAEKDDKRKEKEKKKKKQTDRERGKKVKTK